jgi:hypothetical protein
MRCAPVASNPPFDCPLASGDRAACEARAECAWAGEACAASPTWRCAHAQDACQAQTEAACGAPHCEWSAAPPAPPVAPVAPVQACPAPDLAARNGCARVGRGGPAFLPGDTLRILPREVEQVRTGRRAPLAVDSAVACCGEAPDPADAGEDRCELGLPCLRPAAGAGHWTPAGCGPREVCTVLTRVDAAAMVVDLTVSGSPPLAQLYVRLPAEAGSQVCFRKTAADVRADALGASIRPANLEEHVALREGWYYGELLARRGAAGLVLARATGRVETVAADALYTLDTGWPAALGPVLLGGRALRLGERVRVAGGGARAIGVVVGFDGLAGPDARALCPSAVQRVSVATDAEELRDVGLGELEFLHAAGRDVLRIGSTAAEHFADDAALRYAAALGLSPEDVDVRFLVANLATPTPANASAAPTWRAVWETEIDGAPANDVHGRVQARRDMHPHMCHASAALAWRAETEDSVRRRLPAGFELRWGALCLEVRAPAGALAGNDPANEHELACCAERAVADVLPVESSSED